MRVRKLGAAIGTALFLGATALSQTVVVSPAAATPTIIAGADQRSDPRDFRKGYRDGFEAGWEMAREECEMLRAFAFHQDDDEDDYARGYDRGFDRGFDKGFKEYCD